MRPLRAVGALLAVLVLAGCTGIPTSGAVQAGPTEAPADQGFVVLPQPPANGASQQAVVAGFVQAASVGRDFSVARQYLTPAFAKQWNPAAGVLVHDQSWTTRSAGDDRVELRVPATARVDAEGRYTPVPQRVDLPFSLQKVNGQWRISSAESGVVVLRDSFQRFFQSSTLEYFDPTFTRFVPDVRWFPVRDSQAPAVVRALISRPSGPLAGVVASAFPAGTRVARPVTAAGGLTAVDLTVPGDPSDEALARMQQQLARTLQPSDPAVQLTVNNRLVPEQRQPVANQPVAPVVLAAGRFGELTARGVTEDAVLGRRIVAAKPTAATVSSRQRLAALLTGSGVARVDAKALRVVDSRPGLIAPTLDQQGWIYSVPGDDPGGVRASGPGTSSVRLDEDLGGSAVRVLQASPDGARLLVVVESSLKTPSAYVVGIERSRDGTPTGLAGASYPVAVTEEQVIDATWVDDSTVALLTSGADGQAVTQQRLGGLTTSLGPVANGVAISGPNEQRNPLRVRVGPTGDLFSRISNVWQSAYARPVEVAVLAVQR